MVVAVDFDYRKFSHESEAINGGLDSVAARFAVKATYDQGQGDKTVKCDALTARFVTRHVLKPVRRDALTARFVTPTRFATMW